MRVLSTVLLLSAGVFAGNSLYAKPLAEATDNGTRIVGGVDADAAKWQFIVGLVDAGSAPSSGHFCGGSLIRADIVLTAAHCVDGSAASSIDVWMGMYKRSDAEAEAEKRTVTQIVMHENYDSNTQENDIALLFLSAPSTYPVVELFTSETAALNAGDLLSVAGWGTLTSDGSQPDTLQSVDVAYVTNQVCSAALGGSITDDMLCAGFAEGGKDSCQGDSGGPLVVDINGTTYQAGIVSWGIGCADPNQYGVYSRVSHLKNWIDSVPDPEPPAPAGPTRVIDFESGDFSQETFTFSGDHPWEISNAMSHSPSFSISSPDAVGDHQAAVVELETEVASGQLSFWFNVSSEADYDFLEFSVDNAQVKKWSGETGWQQFSHEVTAGMHKFTWRYSKDQSDKAGRDRAWVDDIALPIARGTRYDQNGDGKADIMWRSSVSGQNWYYGMNGNVIAESRAVNVVNAPWRMIGRGDFNGDGKGDMLWRNDSTGQNYMYLMDGNVVTAGKVINTVPVGDWDIVSIGDYNGDGNDDMLWRNSSTGVIWQYQMDGFVIVSSKQVTKIADNQWQIVSSSDLDGDGKADVLLRNDSTGVVWKYLMDGHVITANGQVMAAGLEWQLVSSGDFDSDGDADILWRNTNDGRNYVYLLDGGVVNFSARGQISQFSDQNWQAVMAGDFDGDGDDDILWRHFGDGRNYMYLMDGTSYIGKTVNTVADLNWKPVK